MSIIVKRYRQMVMGKYVLKDTSTTCSFEIKVGGAVCMIRTSLVGHAQGFILSWRMSNMENLFLFSNDSWDTFMFLIKKIQQGEMGVSFGLLDYNS